MLFARENVLSACLRVLNMAQKKNTSCQQRGRWALLLERHPLSPFLFGLLSTVKRKKNVLLAASPLIYFPSVSAPVCENCSCSISNASARLYERLVLCIFGFCKLHVWYYLTRRLSGLPFANLAPP